MSLSLHLPEDIRFVVFAWGKRRLSCLESDVPLVWHGEWLRLHGWRNPIAVVFLDGYDHVGANYRKRLGALGYHLMDAGEMASDLLRTRPGLRRFNRSEQFWFLRWLVMAQLHVAWSANLHLIHIDGDLVFLDDPIKVADSVAGKTFILQGCPCFTVISDRVWYSEWEKGLSLFIEHPEVVRAGAIRSLNSPRLNPREYGNVLCCDPNYIHDQNLMEYMIADGQLRQARASEVFGPPYYWIQNPLFPTEWRAEQDVDSTARLRVENGRWRVDGRLLPLLHFQKDFVRHCLRALLLDRLGLWRRYAACLHLDPERRAYHEQGRKVRRALDTILWPCRNHRRLVYQLTLAGCHGPARLTRIMDELWT